MEWLGPALDLAKDAGPTASAIVAVISMAAGAIGVHIREMRRHYNVEAQIRQQACDKLNADNAELLVRIERLQAKCEEMTQRYYDSQKEMAALIRDSHVAIAAKAGTL